MNDLHTMYTGTKTSNKIKILTCLLSVSLHLSQLSPGWTDSKPGAVGCHLTFNLRFIVCFVFGEKFDTNAVVSDLLSDILSFAQMF